MPPAWSESLGKVSSGPLKTDGSFMSIQVKRYSVIGVTSESTFWREGSKREAQYSRPASVEKSSHELSPALGVQGLRFLGLAEGFRGSGFQGLLFWKLDLMPYCLRYGCNCWDLRCF